MARAQGEPSAGTRSGEKAQTLPRLAPSANAETPDPKIPAEEGDSKQKEETRNSNSRP